MSNSNKLVPFVGPSNHAGSSFHLVCVKREKVQINGVTVHDLFSDLVENLRPLNTPYFSHFLSLQLHIALVKTHSATTTTSVELSCIVAFFSLSVLSFFFYRLDWLPVLFTSRLSLTFYGLAHCRLTYSDPVQLEWYTCRLLLKRRDRI